MEWRKESKTVVVYHPAPKPADEKFFADFVKKLSDVRESRDADKYLNMFMPDARNRDKVEAEVRKQVGGMQLHRTFLSAKLNYKHFAPLDVVVYTTEEITKTGGEAFHLDHRSTSRNRGFKGRSS